jgi:hypothetical protein
LDDSAKKVAAGCGSAALLTIAGLWSLMGSGVYVLCGTDEWSVYRGMASYEIVGAVFGPLIVTGALLIGWAAWRRRKR